MEVVRPGVETVWDRKCVVAESVTWDESRRWVLFCDGYAQAVLAYGVDDGSKREWSLPGHVRSFGLCDSGRLVVAIDRHVHLFDPESGRLDRISPELPEPPGHLFNDGKVGPDGCFWVGVSTPYPDKSPTGGLYRLEPDGTLTLKSSGYATANGLAWTPDGRTMFHAETYRPFIDRWDFDPAAGTISNRRRIAVPDEAIGRPDGAACDAEGAYWSAGVSAGCLNRFSRDGELLAKYELPFPSPAMPGFAGPDLYIASLRRNRPQALIDRFPIMGGLHRMKAPVAGAPVGRFADRG